MKITLNALAAKLASFPVKFDLCVGIELKRVGMKVRDTAVRKFGHYQPQIGPYPSWAQLAESTIEAKERAGGDEDPLIGHYPSSHHRVWPVPLRNSIESDVEGMKVNVGTQDPLGDWHEFGTSGPHPVPPRPFLRPAAFESEGFFQERMSAAAQAAIRMM